MAQDEEFSPPKPQNALAIFCRAPRLGTVKTRLAQTHGDEFTLGLYRAMLVDTFELGRALAPAVETFACFTPPEAFEGENSLAQLWDGPTIAQCEGDLGERMLDCLAQLRARGFQKVVLIGSDSPDLPRRRLQKAFDSLDRSEFVIGRARDGGFYLFGACRTVPEWTFRWIDWSGPQATGFLPWAGAYNQITTNFLHHRESSGQKTPGGSRWSLERLLAWDDVDDDGDLIQLRRRLFEVGTHAPHTRQFLENHP
ncbi:MAG: glycosyltransferase [Armatimonadetes bacterium]|nr:glycosyltransferase [Armatimonadota bacterium]